MELINIQMEINIKVTGTKTCKMVEEHIITQMVIFIKANGLMEDSMEMETIFMHHKKECIKVIGKKGRNKVLASW